MNSESSDFWDLYKKSNKTIYESSESSDFWNLYKKNYKEHLLSEKFFLKTKKINKVSKASKVSKSGKSSKPGKSGKSSKTATKTKSNKVVAPDNTSDDVPDNTSDEVANDTTNEIPDETQNDVPDNTSDDLISVSLKSNIPNAINQTLPPKQYISGSKKIYDYTISEFYKSFMKNIIEIVRSLKQGKGINTLFNNKEKLLYFGISLIILSLVLIPIIYLT